jgi:hypothetical protein
MKQLKIRISIAKEIDKFIETWKDGTVVDEYYVPGTSLYYFVKGRTFSWVFDALEPIAEAGYKKLERIDGKEM